MDMEIIDTVRADTLAEGDTIRYDGEVNIGPLQEILKVEDDGETVTLFLEDDGETEVHPDMLVFIYGYTDSDD